MPFPGNRATASCLTIVHPRSLRISGPSCRAAGLGWVRRALISLQQGPLCYSPAAPWEFWEMVGLLFPLPTPLSRFAWWGGTLSASSASVVAPLSALPRSPEGPSASLHRGSFSRGDQKSASQAVLPGKGWHWLPGLGTAGRSAGVALSVCKQAVSSSGRACAGVWAVRSARAETESQGPRDLSFPFPSLYAQGVHLAEVA